MPKQTFFNLPDEKRQRILDCAVEEFARQGYKQASISRIVAAAEIAKGSYYQYFEDKDDLYRHIIRTMITDPKLGMYEKERRKLDDLGLMEFLRLVAHRQLEEFQRTPELMKIGIELTRLTDEPVYRRLVGEYQLPTESFFLPFLRQEMARGRLDAGINAQLLNYMLHGLGQYMNFLLTEENGETMTSETLDRIMDDLDHILRGGIYSASSREGGSP